MQELHDESQQWLQDLTTNIGLSGYSLPPNPSPADKEYIRKYILAWFQKYGILICLTKYQDKVNPIQSSKHCGGQLVAKVGKQSHFKWEETVEYILMSSVHV